MADSLRDQLVKSGLATASQAKKAERQKRAEKNANRQGSKKQDLPGGKKGKSKNRSEDDPDSPANVRERARKQKAEKMERDRAIARVANEKAAAKAQRAEITQIVLQNDQRAKAAKDDDVPYNFVHGKKVKKIYVPPAQREQLSAGNLVIVNNDGRYHVVSKEVAEQISARDPKRIVAAHDEAAHENPSQESGADDEYYAKFEVPDDLDW